MHRTIHDAQQGSQQWLDIRAKHFTASEASAMMGASKYMSRTELLRQKKTGDTPEVDAAKQRLFDAGHAAEESARKLIEAQIGEDLFPVTVSIEIDGLPLLASMDGLTMDECTGWECKLYNKELEAQVLTEDIAPHYFWQLEQQMLVSGCNEIIFTASDGTPDRTVSFTYTSQPDRRANLIAGWQQFASDLAAYEPQEVIPAAVAEPQEQMPALSVVVDGSVAVRDNLSVFGDALRKYIDGINRKPETDNDFATIKAASQRLREVQARLASAKESMLGQLADIDKVRRVADDLEELARVTAIELEKIHEAENKNRKNAIIRKGQDDLRAHIDELNTKIGKPYMPAVAADFNGKAKNLRTLESLQNAINTELARAKIEADQIAGRIEANLKTLRDLAKDHAGLFADTAQLVLKDTDAVEAIVKSRIADSKAAEEKRLEVERERIRQEEEVRAAAKVKAEQEEAERLARESQSNNTTATACQNTGKEGTVETPALGQRETTSAAPTLAQVLHAAAPTEIANTLAPIDNGKRIKIGDINALLYPLSVDAAALKHIGFEPVGNEKNAKLYRAQDFHAICSALVQHIIKAANSEVKNAA